jgi:hypothetical protein
MRDGYSGPNQILIDLRLELGKSQEEYAELVGASARQVRNWESGRVRCPQTWYLVRMNRLHGTASPEQLGFKPRPRASRVATVGAGDRSEADVFRRDFLGWVVAAAFSSRPAGAVAGLLSPIGANPEVGQVDIERLSRTNAALFSTDFLIGGAAFRPDALVAQFRRSAGVLHGRFRSDETRRAMHSAVGHLGSTIGFMLFDQGRHVEARRVYAASLQVAQEAFDQWPLRAVIFSEMARQCLQLGEYHESDELLRMARGAEAEVSPTFHAMLHAVHARAAAGLGDVAQTQTYVGMAEDAFSDATPSNDPAWISWFDTAELDGETGAALSLLALKHEELRDETAARLSRSADSHGPTDQRSKALALIRLATIHAVRRDPKQAAGAAREAHDAAAQLQSPRVTDELSALRRHLHPLKIHREIADVDRELATLTV